MKKLILFLLLSYSIGSSAKLFVSNKPWGYFGDSLMSYAIAKSISMHFGIKFYYSKFPHSDLFLFDSKEEALPMKNYSDVGWPMSQSLALSYSDSLKNYLIYTYCLTPCGAHVNNNIMSEIKKMIQPKHKLSVGSIPDDVLSLGVHIRKGSGGGEHYDGELTSEQLFDFDRSMVSYHPINTHAFENLDEYNYCQKKLRWSMDSDYTLLSLKFPPEQYYVDQIVKVSKDLNNPKMLVWIVTDHIDPIDLVDRIKRAVNRPNINYRYFDNRHKDHSQRIIEDIYSLSLCDGLVRSQSHFAKTAELMGNHKFVFFSGRHKWVDKKMVITHVCTKKYEEFLHGHIR